ncbi:MAG TPA: type II toxin-antitoxin system HicB family antitoxin [Bacteroidia bacterium]|nr:type II toxin-antitoxin system HicB family antitoxin [Bacteroidia bacterium]
MNYTYKVYLQPEPEGGYTVIVPSLPGCITYGETIQEARINAKEAIELYLEELKGRGEVVQDDSEILEFAQTVSA